MPKGVKAASRFTNIHVQPVFKLFVKSNDQRILVLEITIDSSSTDICSFGNHRHGGAVKAFFSNKFQCRTSDYFLVFISPMGKPYGMGVVEFDDQIL